MNKILFLLFLCIAGGALAQPNDTAYNKAPFRLTYSVLADSGYSLQRLLTDSGLNFVAGGTIQPSATTVCWLKIVISNPAGNSGRYNMFISPSVVNTIYYFDANAQKWVVDSAGVTITHHDAHRQVGALPFIVSSRPVSVLYVKMNLAALRNINRRIIPTIEFEEDVDTQQQQDYLLYGWVSGVSVLLFFFLYNLYLYKSFKDVSVLYYLVAQAGTVVYFTGARALFRFFLSSKVFNLGLSADNRLLIYNADNLLQHVGIITIFFGLVQLTRSYLNTKTYLPKADKLLKYGLYFYMLATLVLICINMLFFYVEYYTLVGDNIVLGLLVSAIIYTCILGYRRRLRAAGPFLLANILPLAFTVLITLFHVFVSVETINDIWLGCLAVFSQAFCFSVALVTRTKLIQNELSARQMEAQQLGFDIQKINISMQVEKARSELLQERLDANQRELASTTLFMVQKNELLANLKSQIEELNRLYPKFPHGRLSGMEAILKSSMNLDDDWRKFKLHFEQLHPHFFDDLLTKYPTLTNNEVRLCAYFHIKLSHKEIASLLNIAPDSVRRAKTRLLKKMGNDDFVKNEEEEGQGDEDSLS